MTYLKGPVIAVLSQYKNTIQYTALIRMETIASGIVSLWWVVGAWKSFEYMLQCSWRKVGVYLQDDFLIWNCVLLY